MPLAHPAGLVLAAAVLQVQHGIALLRLLVVARRRVDQRVAPRAGHLREVPDLAHLAVRHVLDRVVRRAGFRHLDGARVLAAAEERTAAGVGHLHAVHDQHVVVQARHERLGDDTPHAVRLLHHVDLRPAPEVQPDLRRVGRLQPDLDSSLAVDAGVLRIPDVGGGRPKVSRLLRRAEAARSGQQHQRQSKSCHRSLLW